MNQSSTKFVGFFTITLLLSVLIVWLGMQQPKYFNEEGTAATVPMDQFSPLRAKEKLQQLYVGQQAHPAGTLANDKFKQALISELDSLGYQVEQQSQYQCSGKMRCAYINNIIAYSERPTNKNAILINSHYDSVPSGPGVGDNGVNVAIALEIARYTKQLKQPNPIILLFSDGEEIGLLGAEAFVKHPLAEQVAVVVNLEARGTHGRSLMFETSNGNSPLIDIFADSFIQGKTNSIFQEIYNNLPNDTDFSVFKREGITGYNFAFIGGLNHYHTDNDSLDKIDFNAMAEQGIVAANLVNRLAKEPSLQRQMLQSEDNSGDSLYTDIVGIGVISWSATASMVLTGFVILSILTLVFGQFTVGHSVKRCITSAVFLLLSIIITAGLGYGLSLQISSMQLPYSPWVFYDSEILAVLWAFTLLVGGLLYHWLTKNHSSYERLAGILLWFGLLLVIFAVVANGVSYLYLLPSLPAVLLLLWSKTKGQNYAQLWQNLAMAVFVLIYTILAADIAYLMGLAIGLFAMGIGLSVFLVPVMASLITLARSSKLEYKLLKGGYGVLAVVMIAGLWQISQPFTSKERQTGNMFYFQQDDQAYWLVDRPMRRLAPQLKNQFEFTKHKEGMGLYPSFRSASVLTAEKYDYEALTTIEQQTTTDVKQIQFTFKKAQPDFYYVVLKLPESLKYQTLTLNGKDVTPKKPLEVDKNGYRQLMVYGHYQKSSQLTITYGQNAIEKPLIVDEERSQVSGFNHPKAQSLWDVYHQAYRSVHRGSRSIVRREISL